jgi:hypothetical protein
MEPCAVDYRPLPELAASGSLFRREDKPDTSCIVLVACIGVTALENVRIRRDGSLISTRIGEYTARVSAAPQCAVYCNYTMRRPPGKVNRRYKIRRS